MMPMALSITVASLTLVLITVYCQGLPASMPSRETGQLWNGIRAPSQVLVPTKKSQVASSETEHSIASTEIDLAKRENKRRSEQMLPVNAFQSANAWRFGFASSGQRENLDNKQMIPFLNCHIYSEDYVYFTVAYPNGTFAHDHHGKHALFYITTDWYFSYIQELQQAIFNDPKRNERCPKGHCVSEIIPGVQSNDSSVVLQYIEDPKLHINSWFGTMCEHSDTVRDVTKLDVTIGQIDYFVRGAGVAPAVLDFIEAQMRTTFPILGMAAIFMLSFGLIPGIIALVCLCCGFRCLCRLFAAWLFRRRAAIKAAPRKGYQSVKSACARVKQGYSRSKDTKTSSIERPATNVELYPTSRPPSYKTYDSLTPFDQAVILPDYSDPGGQLWSEDVA
ncbi:hypothetical protein BKA66DRAFT_613181 [Pyrenochaeta sp. MPI-SDFR-AT-0127]|nr:hypothetical protein BKA66DRAFT_613181 [Pyrenochaeta sp. MPI-SDFR-AT-0127]